MNFLDLFYEIGRWSVDAVWLPMLVWTAIALPIFAIQRWTPGVSSHTRYWTTIGLTSSLPIGLIAGAFVAVDAGAVREIAAVVSFPAFAPTAQASSAASAFPWTLWHSAGVFTVIAGVLAALRTATLFRATQELRRFASTATDRPPVAVAEAAACLAEQIGFEGEIRIVVSDSQSSPLTFGWRSPVVVLPRRLLTASKDLRLAMAHEFVHIRRCDYLWQWCEHLIGALFFIHPLVAVLRNEASILREITCDADVLAHVGDRSSYARLLFQYSSGDASRGKLAIGILLRENHLKKRISAMKNRLDFAGLTRSKRIGLAVSVSLLVVAVVAVACTDVLVESTSSNTDPTLAQVGSDKHDDSTFVIVEQMPVLVGGLAGVQSNLRYPEIAKEAGVSGRVIVQFVVDETGEVVDPKIIRGIGSGLDEAALEAVRQAVFKPGEQRGKPVRVKMSIPITFKLDGSDVGSAPGDAALQHGQMTIDQVSPDATEVDQMPEIIGGLEAIQEGLKYPSIAQKAGIEGRVIVEFVVTELGMARDARIVKGVGAGLDEEALRAVQNARFVPAQKKDEPVAMKLTLPITFRLK